ncbi:hypothetical protein LZC95_08215 [Pendulispora brunnea]|uniref:IraD/Gp25-like domain-containing protein n=1 Tax=Pendulispora brunnea TaxID=2905690 RepID=A0ABZ2KGX4_9BACT
MNPLEELDRDTQHVPSQHVALRMARERFISDLSDFLGTPLGSMPGEPEYGVPDVTRIYESQPEAAKEWCLRVENSLRRFFPYFRNPRVWQSDGDELDLTFYARIEGDLLVNRASVLERFDIAVDARQPWRVL